MSIYTESFKVQYSDLQENRFISNVAILRYMQEVACEHSTALGCGMENLSKENLGWVIMNWKLKVHKRLKYNDKFSIKTWCRKVDKFYFYRDFELYDLNNEIIAQGTSKWIWLNLLTKKIERIPEEVIRKHEIEQKETFKDFKFNKLVFQSDAVNKFEYKILKRDLDTNHHTNNLNYLEFAYETVKTSNTFDDVEINYKKELNLDDEIICLCSNENLVEIKNKNTQEINALIKFN